MNPSEWSHAMIQFLFYGNAFCTHSFSFGARLLLIGVEVRTIPWVLGVRGGPSRDKLTIRESIFLVYRVSFRQCF